MNIRTRLRDWWRGYTDADIASAAEKAGRMCRTGEWVGVTHEEMKAIQHGALRVRPDVARYFDFRIIDRGFRPKRKVG